MNNNIFIKLRTCYEIDEFKNFSLSFSNLNVEFLFFHENNYGIDIRMIGKKDLKNCFKLFLIIHELLFLNYGYFFDIYKYYENDELIDYKKYCNLDCYNSHLIRNFSEKIADISELITKESIKSYKTIKNCFLNGLNGMFYLKCENYSKILIDHRFCIISQICEGFIRSTKLEKNVEQSLPNKRKVKFLDRIEFYIKKLDFYNKKYSLRLYKILKIQRKTLLKQIDGSRHMLSHYTIFKDNNGNNKPKLNNNNYLFMYIILEYILRIVILEEITVKLNEEMIENSLKNYKDFICLANQ